MFQNNYLKSVLGLLKYSKIVNKTLLKCSVSTSEQLIPVKLSSALYESPVPDAKEPPLVILHGLCGSKQNWSSLCKAFNKNLNPQRNIIALDLRNHGESEHSDAHSYAHLAVDVKNFLTDFNIDKVSLIGHSMGGRCAMLFALTYPELVDKLIVVDISPITESPQFAQLPSILSSMDSVQFPENVSITKARTIVDKQLAENIPSKDLRAFILTNLAQMDNQRYKWRLNVPVLLENFDRIARFPSISNVQYMGETLFLGGGDSGFIPYHDGVDPKRLVYSLDLRNHGDSPHSNDNSYDDMVMDVYKFLNTMDIKRVSILGHDVGGRVGMLFSLKYPEYVEKLIVIDISPITTSHNFRTIPEVLKILHNLTFPKNMPLQQAKLHVASHLARVLKNRGLMLFLLMNLVQHSDGRYKFSRDLLLRYTEWFSYTWRFNLKALLDNFNDLASFPEIHNTNFPGPTLFIGGAKSDFIQKSDYPKIKKLFPNATLKYIEGAGHWVHSEKPREFLKVTLDFLNTTKDES